jgi:hypothetical protein
MLNYCRKTPLLPETILIQINSIRVNKVISQTSTFELSHLKSVHISSDFVNDMHVNIYVKVTTSFSKGTLIHGISQTFGKSFD